MLIVCSQLYFISFLPKFMWYWPGELWMIFLLAIGYRCDYTNGFPTKPSTIADPSDNSQAVRANTDISTGFRCLLTMPAVLRCCPPDLGLSAHQRHCAGSWQRLNSDQEQQCWWCGTTVTISARPYQGEVLVR